MPKVYVGIDVAKFKHTCCAVSEKGEVLRESFDFGNDREGFDLLMKTMAALGGPGEIAVAMESTGHYHVLLWRFLASNGYAVEVKNPKVIARFKAATEISGAKTDRRDALLIARYAMKFGSSPSPLPSYALSRMKSLEREKYRLIRDRTSLYNRILAVLDLTFPELIGFLDAKARSGRDVLSSKTVRWLVSTHPSAAAMSAMRPATAERLRSMSMGRFSLVRFHGLRELARRSVGTSFPDEEAELRQLLAECDSIDARIGAIDAETAPLVDGLCPQIASVPGIGKATAAMIFAEVGDFGRFGSPDKLIKYAGLDVNVYQSGTVLRHGKMGKKGPPILRYALFLAAGKCRIHCPEIAEYYSSKVAQGKHRICALTCAARKILRMCWGMMKSGEFYTPRTAA